MQRDEEVLKSVGSIYKFVFINQPVHRNILRKKLLGAGKVSSKEKFYRAVELLLNSGNLKFSNENYYIDSNMVDLGLIQKDVNNFYIETQDGVRFDIDKSVAAGYKNGDVVNIIIDNIDDNEEAFILNRSNNVFIKSDKPLTKEKAASKKEKFILGRVVKSSHDNLIFIPNNKNFPIRQIPILNNKEDQADFQDKICILCLKDKDVPAIGGYIKEIKGNAGNPIHEYDSIAANYGANMNWSGMRLEKEISKIPTRVDVDNLNLITESEANVSQKGCVVDLRDLPFVTVDPATCKDMDDAIYSTFNQQGDIVCYTAVANVTKYVDLNSDIGKRYIEGGFTLYAPNKAYNILPTKLSTGICSLNPDEDRLAFVVKTVIDKRTGQVKSSNIYDAIIKSRMKYSYDEAQQITDELKPEVSRGTLFRKYLNNEELSFEEQILMNYYAARSIGVGFENRNMLKFNSDNEKNVIFNDDYSDIIDIESIPHLEYHEVIENFMVTANEATAKYAKDRGIKNIYRIHSEPSDRKVDRAYEFFDVMDISFYGDTSVKGIREILEKVKGLPCEQIVNRFLIRLQSRALYCDKLYGESDHVTINDVGQKISHYALQSPHYSHTTSPIRRVPDFVTQYNILASIHGHNPLSNDKILNIVEKMNERQIKIDQAERDFENVNAAIYCEHHIGEKMSGQIVKFRDVEPEDDLDENIIVIVENEEKGIKAEIPLSQILGREAYYCDISKLGCAVYDSKGRPVLTVCTPVDFIIENADRKSMRVIGKTNQSLVSQAIARESNHDEYSINNTEKQETAELDEEHYENLV